MAWTFGVVAFSLIVQGLTIKPLLRILGMATSSESEYNRARVRQIALSSARAELDDLLRSHAVSAPLHARLRQELDSSLGQVESEIAEIYKQDEAWANEEIRTARLQLIAAERGAIQRALYDGLISPQTASNMIEMSIAILMRWQGRLQKGGRVVVGTNNRSV